MPLTGLLLREDTPSPSDDEEVDEQQRSEYLEDMGCLEKYFSDLKEMSVPNTWHGACMVCDVSDVCSTTAAVYTVRE